MSEEIKAAEETVESKVQSEEKTAESKPKKEKGAKGGNTVSNQSIELRELIDNMKRVLGTKVSVLGNDNRGRIYIDYYSRADLDRISELLEKMSK